MTEIILKLTGEEVTNVLVALYFLAVETSSLRLSKELEVLNVKIEDQIKAQTRQKVYSDPDAAIGVVKPL